MYGAYAMGRDVCPGFEFNPRPPVVTPLSTAATGGCGMREVFICSDVQVIIQASIRECCVVELQLTQRK